MIRIYDWRPDVANHLCVMHDTFTWLMVTSDVGAGLLKQRLVVCTTAPLTEINRGLKCSEKACEMRIFIQLWDSVPQLAMTNLRLWIPFFLLFLTDKQLWGHADSSFKKHQHPYVWALFDTNICMCWINRKTQAWVSDVQFMRRQAKTEKGVCFKTKCHKKKQPKKRPTCIQPCRPPHLRLVSELVNQSENSQICATHIWLVWLLITSLRSGVRGDNSQREINPASLHHLQRDAALSRFTSRNLEMWITLLATN